MTGMHKRFLAIIIAAGLITALAACGASSDDSVPVEQVSSVMAESVVTQEQIFIGVVSAGQEASIQKDSDRTVEKVYVTAGDTVKEGDKLFSYDAESTEDSLEQARLELEEQKNTLEEKQEEKKQDEEDMAKAASSEQLEYTLAIQEVDADIREAQYQIGIKEKEIERLEEAVKNLDVTAPFDGVVESAGTADASSGSSDSDGTNTYDSSSGDSSGAFIRIMETGNYRVKGSVNEMNIAQVQEGMEMTILSRTDFSRTWTGTVTEVSTSGGAESKTSDTEYESYYGSSDDSSSYKNTSTYAFYVTLDALDGLMIGQHVYLTAASEDPIEGEFVYLPSSFINDSDSEPWVWTENDGILEKRHVSLGTYNEERDLYQITEGLTKGEYITSSTGNLEEGMTCSRKSGGVVSAADNTDDAIPADAETDEVTMGMNTDDGLSGAAETEGAAG